MVWVTGYNSSGINSIAGPFQEKVEAEAQTQSWTDNRVYQINTSDRNVAIREIMRIQAQRKPIPQRVETQELSRDEDYEEEEEEDDDEEDDDDFLE